MPKGVERGPIPARLRSRFRWDSHDALRGFTYTAVVGATVFVALAVAGLPDVDLHSPLHYAGVMDPLCGMTRAMEAIGQADFASAWRYNPASFALAAAGAFFTVRFLVGVLTTRWLVLPMPSRRVIWSVLVPLVAILWVNQQLNADTLMS